MTGTILLVETLCEGGMPLFRNRIRGRRASVGNNRQLVKDTKKPRP